LVFVKASTEDHSDNSEKVVSGGRYYFNNGILIYSQENGAPVIRPATYLQLARAYLAASVTKTK
jgi:hypothetical protein